MLTKYFISVALLCMLLCASIDAEIFEDTIAIEEGAKAEDVTPFKSIFFPVGTNDCRVPDLFAVTVNGPVVALSMAVAGAVVKSHTRFQPQF
ncbi:hypothetical protein Ocin01_15894 [Orchesella cincta]|uniref:Uncharacterized protein n=1 Tax=Orchesella cincta TaxID=48709 RepID=A0A1D2MCT0_ORCCI|nr:hypothetical protein Ocin01_15894 [Orchesella cincta]